MWTERLSELDDHHKAWCDSNFPYRTAFMALAGIVEEAGEWAAAKTTEDEEDALADMFLYMLDFCRLTDMNVWFPDSEKGFAQQCRLFWDEKKYPITPRGLLKLVGQINHCHLKNSQNIRGVSGLDTWLAVASLSAWLHVAANTIGSSIESLALEAWSFVRLRDWKRFPKDGVSQ